MLEESSFAGRMQSLLLDFDKVIDFFPVLRSLNFDHPATPKSYSTLLGNGTLDDSAFDLFLMLNLLHHRFRSVFL